MSVDTNPPTGWLLETGDAWVRYRTRVDLLGQAEMAPEVQTARAAMVDDPRLQAMIASLQDWPGPPLTSHKKAGHPLHLLSFVAELGVRAGDPGVDSIIERVLQRQSEEGAFQISIQIRESYGGTGQPMLSWMLCDAPLVLWALCRLGAQPDARVGRAVEHLTAQIRENGWPCGTERGFRGPGRKSDPCPYATLLSLKALGVCGESYAVEDHVIQTGIDTLLWHWEIQKERKLYLFGIGTDFRKPKFPLVWYDILHLTDVLSRFPTARRDPRYQAMLAALMVQADDAGRFTAASMYRAWKGWEFADKKRPSPAITLIAWRAARRQQARV